MRRSGGRAVRRSALIGVLLLGGATSLHAQDSLATPRPISPDTSTARPLDRPTVTDSAHRPTTPMRAMFRSFLIPGWGQAVFGRKVTAGMMLGVEGLSWGMLLKIQSEERYIEQTHSANWHAKRQESQDWYTILVFNHLMSGLEAYVSAHLYDFPGDLQMQVLPGGGTGVGVTLPIGPR